MKTVGGVLQEARKAHKLSIVDVSLATRIPIERIEQLEAGAHGELPAPPFVKGYIRNIAKLLDLDVLQLAALYRREVDERHANRVAFHPPAPLSAIRLRLTATMVLIGGAAVIMLIFFGYLFFAYQSFAGKPMLVVSTPEDETTVTADSVLVSGRAEPSATLTINDQEVSVGRGGRFSVDVPIHDGANTIRIRVVNDRGGERVEMKTVVRKRPGT